MTSPMGSAPAAMFGLSIHGQKGDHKIPTPNRDESRWASLPRTSVGSSEAPTMLAAMYGTSIRAVSRPVPHLRHQCSVRSVLGGEMEWFARYDWAELYGQNFRNEPDSTNNGGTVGYFASRLRCAGLGGQPRMDGHNFK